MQRAFNSNISLCLSPFEEEDVRTDATPSKMQVQQYPHFFKVVMFPNDLGLKIPFAFMRKYGGELQEVVLLNVPTGASWQVELIHYGDTSLLHKGWQEFAEFYSIRIGHFLVFRYEGNLRFHVLIFDPTAMEVEYPSKAKSEIRSSSLSQTFGERSCSPCAGPELNIDDEFEEEEEETLEVYQTTQTSEGKSAQAVHFEDDVSIEIIDDSLSGCKSRMSQRTRSSPRLTENTYFKNTKAVKKGESSAGDRRSSPTSTYPPYCKTKIYKENIKLYQEAKSSRPYFITFLQPSHVSSIFRLDIPKNFLREHLISIKKDCKFMLHVSGDVRKWPVILRVFRDTGRTRISDGFSKFVKDNNLKVGDVCVFELGLQGRREFNVTVYRSSAHEMVA